MPSLEVKLPPPDPEVMEEIARALARQVAPPEPTPGPTPGPPARPPRGRLEDIIKSAVRGPFETVGGAVDLLELGFQALDPDRPPVPPRDAPLSEQRVLSTRFLEKALGLPDPAETLPGQVAGAITGTVPFGPVGKVGKAPEAAKFAERMLASRAPNIGRSAAIGTTGLLGGEAAGTIFPESTTARVLGALGGGLGGALAPSVLRATGRGLTGFTPGMRAASLRRKMEEEIGKRLEPGVGERAAQATRLGLEIPRFAPFITPAEVSPALQSISRVVRRESSELGEGTTQRLTEGRQVLVDEAERLAPPAGGTLETAQQAAQAERQAALRPLEQEAVVAREGFDVAARPIQAAREVTDVGDDVGARLLQRYKEENTRVSAPFKNLGDETIPGPLAPVQDTIARLRKSTAEAFQNDDFLPTSVTSAVKRLAKEGEEPLGPQLLGPTGRPLPPAPAAPVITTIFELRGLRTSIMLEQLRENAAAVPRFDLLKRMGILERQLDETIKDAIGAADPAKRAALIKANAEFKIFRDTFNRGPVGQAFQGGTRGEVQRLGGGQVFNLFFNAPRGQVRDNIHALEVALGKEEVQRLAREAIQAKLRTAIDDVTGVVNPEGVRRVLTNAANRELLTLFPAIRKETVELLRSGQRIKQPPLATTQDIGRLRATETTVVRQLLGENPSRAIRTILDSDNPTQGLQQARAAVGGNAVAETAIMRALYQELLRRGGITSKGVGVFGDVDSKQLGTMLSDPRNQQLIRAALGGDEAFEVLVRVQKAAQFIEESPLKLPPVVDLPTPETRQFVARSSLQALRITMGAAISRRFMLANLIGNITDRLTLPFTEREIRIILADITSNPQLLTTLGRIRSTADADQAVRGIKQMLRQTVAPALAPVLQQVSQQEGRNALALPQGTSPAGGPTSVPLVQ